MRLADLPSRAFAKADPTSDTLFYAPIRMVAHIDERAIGALTGVYAEHLAPGMRVLDLMSSRYSHLPELALDVTGHGMNAAELEANPALDRHVVRDLNEDPTLPFADRSFDAALCCVSVQYLQHPVAVFAEVARVLGSGAPFVVSFSNRCFPTKAIALWHALTGARRAAYVGAVMEEAGFADVQPNEVLPGGGVSDPLWTVIGRAPRGPAAAFAQAEDRTSPANAREAGGRPSPPVR